MALQSLSKLNIDKALKFALVCIVITSLMMSWIYIPQAEAVVAPALVYGAGVGSEVIGSVIAALVMAAVGVSFDNGFFGDTDNLSTMAYELGYELVRDISLFGGAPSAWLDEVVGLFAIAQGFKAGDTIEVPAEVLEYTRNWVNENYDFTGNISFVNDCLISDTGDVFMLSSSSPTSISSLGTSIICTDYIGLESVPYTVSIGNLEFGVGYFITEPTDGRFQISYGGRSNYINNKYSESGFTFGGSAYLGSKFDTFDKAYEQLSSKLPYYVSLCVKDNYIYPVLVYPDDGIIVYGQYFCSLSTAGIVNHSANSSISGSDALSVPQTEDITISVPEVSMGDIGGYSVPAVQQLTGDMVIDKTTSDSEEEVVPDVGGIDTEPSFTVPDTWSGIDAWFKAQGLKLTNIFTEVRDFVKAFPQTLNDSLAGVLEGVLEAVNEPVRKIKDKFNEAKNKLLPFIKNGFGFPSIWHYVVAWVGTLGAWLTTMFTVWSGLPYAMVLPVYATAVVVIVIGIYRRFFM